jgi:hypothetical protein
MEQVKTELPSVVMRLVEGFFKIDSYNSSFFIFPLYLLVCLALHVYLKNLAIVVEEKGVTFQGFLFSNIGKHYAWQDFAQIRRVPPSQPSQREALVFIDRFGRSFLVHFGKPETPPKRKFFSWFALQKEEKRRTPVRFFVGEGHALSLPEAVEAFYGPVTPLEEAEKKKIPALNPCFGWNPVIKGRASYLVFAATGLILLALILGNLTPYFLLDNWQKHACGWASWLFCGLGFTFAWRCLRQEESREAAWIISLLFAAPLWFLVMPTATLLPAWLGGARQETFVLQNNCCNQQNWQSETNPDLSFTQEIPCSRQAREPHGRKQGGQEILRKRQPRKPGAQREFTVYHGPLGLYAMPLSELAPLAETCDYP